MNYSRKLAQTIALASAAALLTSAHGAAIFWTNGSGDNDWFTNGNWDATNGGDPPPIGGVSARDQAVIDLAGADRAILGSGATGNFSAMRIGYEGSDGEFVQTGGSLQVTNNSSDASRVGRNGASGTWTMTGGTADINSIQLALSSNQNTSGSMTVSGGDLLISRGSNGNNGLSASLNVGFGSVASFEISGSARFDTRVGIQVGMNANGSGLFSVVGSSVGSVNLGAGQIGVGSHATVAGYLEVGANGTLSMTVDLGGVSSIFLDEANGVGAHYANFLAGSQLDLGFDSGVTPYEGTWTLVELENGVISTDVLTNLDLLDSDEADGWAFAVDNTGPNGLLTATYTIPEPSSALLVGSTLLLGVGMRRRRS